LVLETTDQTPAGGVAIRDEAPHTKKELRTLLGAFGYYREYIDIPHYSEIARPLTDLAKKGVPNVLDDLRAMGCQQAFVR